MSDFRNFIQTVALSTAVAGAIAITGTVHAGETLLATKTKTAIKLDGKIDDWRGISGVTVPLTGKGGVDEVELKATVRGDTIYVLAVWKDPTKDVLHKPYKWNDASQSYKKTKQMEDRFAISFRMSGDFSFNKIDGSDFEADVWHWKSSRSNPAGVAHDKMWKVSTTSFPRSKSFKTRDGKTVFLARMSDAGDRLYKPLRYSEKSENVMPRYQVNLSPKGSIADVRAKGMWRDGRWYLELARKLDTGHQDDAVIPSKGGIKIAVAAFNGVDGNKHSVSETFFLRTSAAEM